MIIFHETTQKADTNSSFIGQGSEEQEADYIDKFSNPFPAAVRGYVDDILIPRHAGSNLNLALYFKKWYIIWIVQ